MVLGDQGYDLWAYDVRSGAGLRLTHEGGAGANMAPIWTPEGGRIVFREVVGPGNWDLFWIAADGSGGPDPLVTGNPSDEYSTSVSADGRALIFTRIFDVTHREVWEVPLDGDGTPHASPTRPVQLREPLTFSGWALVGIRVRRVG